MNKWAYYNDTDPYVCEWVRNLCAAGHIPDGYVDSRSIADVQPDDLRGFRQVHMFCGIAGWPLAGWPDDLELWTGSAPCQPFSVAGKQRGTDDHRHLWPHLFRLASARRPAVLMGEQVAAAVGKNWLDGVFADLESIGYACGAAVVPAAAVDAPHRRDRLWFVAERDGARASEERQQRSGQLGGAGGDPGACVGDVADGSGSRCAQGRAEIHAGQGDDAGTSCLSSPWQSCAWIIGHDGKARRVEPSIRLLAHGVPARVGRLRAYGNAIVPALAAEVIGAYMDCRP